MTRGRPGSRNMRARFIGLLAMVGAACATGAVAQPEVPAADARFVEGQHYHLLASPQPTTVAAGKVEVAEVFWYGCPHCYRAEPYLQAWQESKPADVEFVQIPAVLNPAWYPHAKLFYATRALGVFEQAHTAVFHEVHVNRNPLNTIELMVEFLGRFGVAEEDARKALTSFAVETDVRIADARVRHYRLTGVPAVVINGKYVAGANTAGSYEALVELIDYLVALESGAVAD